MPDSDLTWALKQYRPTGRREKYELFWNYYEGNHRLAFATDKFKNTFGNLFSEFSENLCAPVVDAVKDRLKVTGFRTSLAEVKTEDIPSSIEGVPARQKVITIDPEGERAWRIWGENRMDLRSKDVHQEALQMGDAYVIVWPDERMRPTIWPQLANEVSVQYDPNTQGKVLRGSKMWHNELDKHWYLNIYTADSIVKYRTKGTTQHIPEGEGEWVPYDGVTNPYGIVPIFHFSNRTEYRPGTSELRDVISVQDGLNKAVMDMLVAMEFAAFKQRYIIGHDPEVDPDTGEVMDGTGNYGVNRMLSIPDPEAKMGQFDATDLGQFLRVQEKFWSVAARVSGTPLHYFFITEGDFPSGEAMKSAEMRFVTKLEDCQIGFGNRWEDVMKFAMSLDAATDEEMTISTQWQDASPRSESELADTAVKKKAVGVPRSQLLREMDYSEEEIERFLQESDAEAITKYQLAQKNEDEEGTGDTRQSRVQPTGQNTRGVQS